MDATKEHPQPKRHHTNAFLFYCHEQYKINKEENRQESTADIGNRWKLLPKDEKQKYLQMEKLSSEQYFLCRAKQPQKAESKIQTRTSLASIAIIVQKLNDEQRQAVLDIGLGGLLGLRCTRLNLELCEFVVDNFNLNSCSLNVHGRELPFTLDDVSRILGLRSNGTDIDIHDSLRGTESLHETVGVVNGVIPLDRIRDYLQQENMYDAGDQFKRKFGLYALGALLCPTTKTTLSLSHLHFVKDIDAMKNCNWGRLVFQSLLKGISKYKGKNFSGCLFLLMLFYLDNVSPTFDGPSNAMRAIPRLNYWGDDQLRETVRLFRKLGGFNHEVKVNFIKLNQPNDHPIDAEKSKFLDEMRLDIGDLKNTMRSMVDKVMEIEQKGNTTTDGVDTRQEIRELKDVVHNLEDLIIKHVVRPHQFVANNGQKTDNYHMVEQKTDNYHMVEQKTDNYHMVEQKNVEEDDTTSIECVGVQERTPKKRKRGLPMKEEKEMASHVDSITLPNSESGSGRGRGGGRRGKGQGVGSRGRGPITRTTVERRPASKLCSPYLAEGVKRVKRVPKVQINSRENGQDEETKKNMGKFLDNIFETSVNEHNPSASLTPEEELMVKFIFDKNGIQGDTVISIGLGVGKSVEYAYRNQMCCLKPKAWINSTVINLVVHQQTNKQHGKYPDGNHKIWYLPDYVSQMIIKTEACEGTNKKVADYYFKSKGYSGPIGDCEEMYVPFNHNNNHWMCLKIDMVGHAAYIFDSKPSPRLQEDRKKEGELLVGNMHEVLKLAYGPDYLQDISRYKVQLLTEQPLQDDTDGYDCGLFVIKYMQGAPLSPGVQMFEPIERYRLLVDLLKDANNDGYLEFKESFDMYKASHDIFGDDSMAKNEAKRKGAKK